MPENELETIMAQISSFGVIGTLMAIASSIQIFSRKTRTSHNNSCKIFCMVSSFMSSIITIIGAVILYIVYPVFVQTDTIKSLDSNNTVVTTLNWIFLISYVYLFNSIHTYSHGIFYNMVSRGYVKTGYILY